jgi:hypothetical protein
MIDVCTCVTFEDDKAIRMCVPHHKYYLANQELASVSSVVDAVYRKYQGVTPAVLEHARIRGVKVDKYLQTYVATGDVTTEVGEWVEVLQRLEQAIGWWDKNVNGEAVSVQKILYSERNGIAGTPDFLIGDMILDLKTTSRVEKWFAIQIGAYTEMADASRSAILHVTEKACKLVPYDAEDVRQIWQQARSWYACVKRLEGGFQ